MNAERNRIAQRCAEILLIEPLVVQSMPSFMDATEEAGLEIVFMNARRHAHIRRVERGGERMSRQIEPTALKVIAHGRQHQSTELHLSRLVIGVMQDAVVDLNPALCDCFQQRHQTGLECRKHRPESSDRRARLIDVQERVVGRVVIAEVLCFFTFEIEHGPEIRQEHRKFISLVLRPTLVARGNIHGSASRQNPTAVFSRG